MKYKEGDKVIPVRPRSAIDRLEFPQWVIGMDKYNGVVSVIESIGEDFRTCRIHGYDWNEKWLRPAAQSIEEKRKLNVI